MSVNSIPHLDLDAIEASDEPSMTFNIGGRTWHCKGSDEIPWPIIEEFFKAQGSGDVSAVVMNVDTLFEAVLFPDEVEDFMAMKQDKQGPMTYKRFSELAKTVAEEVFGVPTEPPGISPTGRRPSARTSGGGSSSQAKRSRRAS
jgi:hypothetical protein